MNVYNDDALMMMMMMVKLTAGDHGDGGAQKAIVKSKTRRRLI